RGLRHPRGAAVPGHVQERRIADHDAARRAGELDLAEVERDVLERIEHLPGGAEVRAPAHAPGLGRGPRDAAREALDARVRLTVREGADPVRGAQRSRSPGTQDETENRHDKTEGTAGVHEASESVGPAVSRSGGTAFTM